MEQPCNHSSSQHLDNAVQAVSPNVSHFDLLDILNHIFYRESIVVKSKYKP